MRLASLLLLIPLLLAHPVHAAPLTAADILAQFNAVIRGDFASPSDVEGRTVVGGNVTQGATFFNNPGAAAPSTFRALTVYGDVTTGGALNVNNGGGATIGGSNAAVINTNGGGGLSTGAIGMLPAFGSTFVDPLLDLSASLAALPMDSFVPVNPPGFPNNVVLTAGSGSGLAVFAVTTTYLSSLASFSVDLNGRSGVVFNVSGASFAANANFLNAVQVARDVIWNFTDATNIAFGTQWGGTVLAPNATVTNATPIEGTLFANAYRGTGELHSQPFRAPLPTTAVPEPAGLALFALALTLLAGAMRRRA
jgi:choice-of-anchor A domain-containing protein